MSKTIVFLITLCVLLNAMSGPAMASLGLAPETGVETTTSHESIDPTGPAIIELDQIVITASKIPLTLRETTKPVRIIDRDEITRNGSRNLGQLLNQQSGIRINDAFGSPANPQTFFMQGASGQYTLLLIDGMPINDPSGTGGTYDLRLLPLSHVERIEILPGSHSTLYGTDAIAGVVNIITQSGGDKPVNGSSELSYGSWNTLQSSAGLHGSLRDNISYTLDVRRESTDGFSAAADPDQTGSFGNDGFLSHSVHGKIDLRIADGLSVTPFFMYSDYEGDYDDGAFQDAANEFSMKTIHTGFRSEFRRDNLNLHAGYSLTDTERTFLSQFGEDAYEGVFHNADVYGSYATGDHIKILGGFNYQHFTMPGDQAVTRHNARIASPYATIYLTGRNGLRTELGFRLNSHSEYGSNNTYSFAPSYHFTPNLKLFGSATTGFKAPTLNELFGPFGANPDLDPQRSRYLSAGLEAYLLQQSLKVRTLFFNREIDDLIIYTFPDGFVNRDRQNDSGFELSVNWMPVNAARLGAHYNYTDGELITKDESGEEVRTNNLLRRPKHHIGMNLGVQATEHLLIRLDGEYNGSRSDLYFNPVNFMQEEVTLDPYTLVHLYAEYAIPSWHTTVFADVRNLLDTDFTEVYGFQTAGISLKGGIRVAL